MTSATDIGRIVAFLLGNLIDLATRSKSRNVRASAGRNVRRRIWRLILDAQQGSEEALEALRAVKDRAVPFLKAPPERPRSRHG